VVRSGTLEFRRLDPGLQGPLSEFFRVLCQEGDATRFHPHPLTDAEAARIVRYEGKDLYYVAVQAESVVGYGMLRGWDAGFDVPSLGIAFHPAVRGKGLGRAFMMFLHAAARQCGATRVRLKVYRENLAAIGLYESLGYRFEGEEAGQLVGIVTL
jgi:ribosomal protein S18 acetylase RimI-like enzyme